MSGYLFEGTMTALVTPMKDDGSGTLDLPALEALVEQQIAGGIDGLVACGTTGEAATLDHDEWTAVVGTVVKAAAGRVPVIAGTGSNDTHKTIATTRAGKELGIAGALVVVPYYNKPSQAGLIAHFRAVMDAVDLPVILYNVPGRTACNLLPATVAELATHPNAAAVKEASGSLAQVQEIVDRTEGRFAVLSGDDALCVPMYAVGGCGVISVVSNPAPALTAALYRDHRRGDVDAAAKGQVRLRGLIETLFSEPNPQPAKMAMHLLGLMSPAVRLPLLKAGGDTAAKLRRHFVDLGLL